MRKMTQREYIDYVWSLSDEEIVARFRDTFLIAGVMFSREREREMLDMLKDPGERSAVVRWLLEGAIGAGIIK